MSFALPDIEPQRSLSTLYASRDIVLLSAAPAAPAKAMPAAASRLIISFDMIGSPWSVTSAKVAGDVVVVVAVAFGERVDLLLGFVLRDPVRFLDLAGELVALARDRVDLIVGELAPLFLDLAGQLLPVPFDAIPVHVGSFSHGPTWPSHM